MGIGMSFWAAWVDMGKGYTDIVALSLWFDLPLLNHWVFNLRVFDLV